MTWRARRRPWFARMTKHRGFRRCGVGGGSRRALDGMVVVVSVAVSAAGGGTVVGDGDGDGQQQRQTADGHDVKRHPITVAGDERERNGNLLHLGQ